MGLFDKRLVHSIHSMSFLSRNSNEAYQIPFPKVDEYDEKALPTLSNSLKSVVSKNFVETSPPDTPFLSLPVVFISLSLHYISLLHA